jgi:hypothetical protein
MGIWTLFAFYYLLICHEQRRTPLLAWTFNTDVFVLLTLAVQRDLA